MELILENKAKFFAQYWGQKVGRVKLSYSYLTLNKSCFLNIDYLELKPLSSITDEDAYYVGATVNCWSWAERKQDFFKDDEMKDTHIGFGQMFSASIGKELGAGHSHPFANNSTDILHAYDYLRSKSYALPWMGLSVDQMIEAGWIKLKTN